ncbi:antibiotic biosynthesis monooxygenase family protein [Rubrobacter marinus]|uniref:antibiotic biosynthesis monooxygenase family protein n=1 Tax=Rubrobacter marinus TaxID=2653852 RepID=UPI00140835BC|nr:antibiotic biosynthesis monooxygenase [Rubrobacter marinus]
MHARVTNVRIDPDLLEGVVNTVRGTVASSAAEQKGFKGLMMMSDPETGEGLVISLWETKEDLEASEASGYYEEQLGRVASALVDSSVRQVYGVNLLRTESGAEDRTLHLR